ncbi:MAG: polyprenyl synthetase family protein [Sumerlaeia bacterium]
MKKSTIAGTEQTESLHLVDYLYDYIGADLERVRGAIDRAYDVQGDLMRDVAAYVRQGRGKMLRPALVCLAARAHGYDADREDGHIALAAAIELFHVATLLHDDVIDKAPLRRGRETVNAKWGDDVAILMADFLYATSFDLALSTLNPATLRLLAQTTQKMTEGEMLQIERRGDWLTVDDYMTIIERKTAILFSAASGLGAMIAGAEYEDVERAAQYGLSFGMAYQITDDTLDYEAQTDNWGKRVGADLKEGKQTLPLLQTLAVADAPDREALRAVLGNGRDFATVQGYVHKYKAIDTSLEVAADFSTQAIAALEDFPPSNRAAQIMRKLVDEILVRQH